MHRVRNCTIYGDPLIIGMRSRTKAYPRTVRELVDQDYLAALSPKDRAFLEKFNDEFYGASFTDEPLHASSAARRDLYNIKNARNTDIYGRGSRSGAPPDVSTEGPGGHVEKDWSTPRHVDRPEYREALNSFRSLIPADRRKKTPRTQRFLVVREQLDVAAGTLLTRLDMEGEDFGPPSAMAKTRMERLEAQRSVLWDLGVTVANAQFQGKFAENAVKMLSWLEAALEKTETKLISLGWKKPTDGNDGR